MSGQVRLGATKAPTLTPDVVHRGHHPVRFDYRRRACHHRAGGQNHLPDPISVERWPVAFPSADGTRLSGSGHGGADDRGLRDLRLCRGTGADHAWPRAVAGPPLRVLVRAAFDHHPAGLRYVFIAAGMAEENWLRFAMSAMVLGVGALPDPPRHDRASGPDPAG